ncbi:uncharacterized protein LOC135463294 [Liolophura sinensis]|uniref:uncharacterized protein LOC135463294 n=1 Tax=Liolophura sinensis TaxID=3198878 RepID=UPI003158A36D
MGVTLERVQNKFACIIGELCSEPVILSQFAIWVDLRIAEYKAKGAISLEISGEDPDPSWLRGHKPSVPPVESRDRTPDMYDPTGGSDSNFNSDIGHAHLVEDRLSPEVVMVKDEPADSEHREVFPVSLHGNSSLVSNPQHKRKHSGTLTSGSSIHHSSSLLSSSSSPAKIHRLSQSSNLSTPGTQSLMSIISDIPGSSNNNSANQNLDSSRLSDTSQSKGDNFLSGYMVSNPGSHSAHLQNNSSVRIPEGHGTSDNADAAPGPSGIMTSPKVCGADYGVLDHHLHPQRYPDRLSIPAIKQRVNVENKKSMMDIAKSVATLERWLWAKFGEERNIEEIPAAELDSYLAEFYPILRKESGEPYHVKSLFNLRYCLDRFLRDRGYQHSISKSQAFERSQFAFKAVKKVTLALAPGSGVGSLWE